MALTITPQISGQQADGTLSYCFLNEPLKVHITDSDITVNEIFCDVTQINNNAATGLPTNVKYVVRDIVSLGGIVVDLMKVVKQLHDFDVYHFSDDSDLSGNAGKDSVLSKYIYRFDFYTNVSSSLTTILKLPILGGRTFENFVPAVNHLTPIVELLNFDNAYLKNYTNVSYTLKDISAVGGSDYSLTTVSSVVTQGDESCEGRIIWKSKLGAWMYWGMNLKTSKPTGSYQGSIDNGMFESTNFSGGGNAYIPVNYTSVNSNYSISLKCLSLTALELIAVSEINGSPAVYYQKDNNSSLELMKLTSASAPIKTHINGGDFSVSLSGLFEYESRVK
tara:strand:+ start:8202 stop:9206 length:1005 start_codon:yes stop_codon:yes gene_type:complete